MRYHLSLHSFFCLVDGHAVFLDLKRDEYTTIGPEEALALSGLLHGCSGRLARQREEAQFEDASHELARTLLREGLLTSDPTLGKPLCAITLPTPTNTFWVDSCPWPFLEPHHLRNFAMSWLKVAIMLRCLPLHRVIRRARERKENAAKLSPPFEIERARSLAVNYFVLQPAFFSSFDACLKNSLTLIEFLARYRIYPTLVFGVKMHPFAAHAWVQHEDLIFADHVEKARLFTPIMAV